MQTRICQTIYSLQILLKRKENIILIDSVKKGKGGWVLGDVSGFWQKRSFSALILIWQDRYESTLTDPDPHHCIAKTMAIESGNTCCPFHHHKVSFANTIDINWYEAGEVIPTLELLLEALHRLHHLLTKLTWIGTKQGRNIPTLELLLGALHSFHH